LYSSSSNDSSVSVLSPDAPAGFASGTFGKFGS